MANSKIPSDDDFHELLEANNLTDEDIAGVCVHLKTVNDTVLHWHYLAAEEMENGRWVPVIL